MLFSWLYAFIRHYEDSFDTVFDYVVEMTLRTLVRVLLFLWRYVL